MRKVGSPNGYRAFTRFDRIMLNRFCGFGPVLRWHWSSRSGHEPHTKTEPAPGVAV